MGAVNPQADSLLHTTDRLYVEWYARRYKMKVMTISEARRNFAAVVDAVIDDAEEAVIPRGGGRAVVIVSLDEWNSMKETLRLLDTPGRARRLLESIAQADAGLVTEHELIDPETLDSGVHADGESKAVA